MECGSNRERRCVNKEQGAEVFESIKVWSNGKSMASANSDHCIVWDVNIWTRPCATIILKCYHNEQSLATEPDNPLERIRREFVRSRRIRHKSADKMISMNICQATSRRGSPLSELKRTSKNSKFAVVVLARGGNWVQLKVLTTLPMEGTSRILRRGGLSPTTELECRNLATLWRAL